MIKSARWLPLVSIIITSILVSGCLPRSTCVPPKGYQASIASSTAATGKVTSQQAEVLNQASVSNSRIISDSSKAQALFEAGLSRYLQLDYLQAEQSFQQAVDADNHCAMCYWGLALTLNSKANSIMQGDEYARGAAALDRATSLIIPNVTPQLTQDLIRTVGYRFKHQVLPHFRTTLDNGYFAYQQPNTILQIYTDAMGRIVPTAPPVWSADVKLLFVMAQLEANDWQAWTHDGQPLPETRDLIELTKSVLAADPKNPSANLFYVKLMQNSRDPHQALRNAYFLLSAVPDEGTLPITAAGLFGRLSDYYNAATAAELAIQAYDRHYAEHPKAAIVPDYLYQYSFYVLSRSDTQQGKLDAAMGAARALRQRIYPEDVAYVAELPILASEPYFILTRFGKWERALQEPQPIIDHPFTQASWHFMRGMAMAANYRLDLADQELQQVQQYHDQLASNNRLGHEQLELEQLLLQARIQLNNNEERAAIETLHQAIGIEAHSSYGPIAWFMPVRQALGQVYIEAGDYTAAQNEFLDDLKLHPGNPWALLGLSQAYSRANKTEAASQAHSEFARKWRGADEKINKSWM